MRICAKCRHHWMGSGYHECFARATLTQNPVTGVHFWHTAECDDRNSDGNCPDFEPRGLVAWLKRLLGLNATPAGETMQAAQQRTEIQWLDKSEARDGD